MFMSLLALAKTLGRGYPPNTTLTYLATYLLSTPLTTPHPAIPSHVAAIRVLRVVHLVRASKPA